MKILLITEIYPSPRHGTINETRICHYFANEWAKMGHQVRVIHFNPLLPWYYTIVGKILRPFVKKNWSVLFKNNYRHMETYTYEEIPVIYIPMFKKRHGASISIKEQNKVFLQAQKALIGYEPDIIVGHWESMVYLMQKMKEQYPKAKTGLVLHEALGGKVFGDSLPQIGVWGFRNKAIKDSFETHYGRNYKGFFCNSGIPINYLAQHRRLFKEGVKNFVFVGKLMELKRVENTIFALHNVYGSSDYHFDIVGDGVCMQSLHEIVAETKTEKQVTFHGWQPRDKAQHILELSDCFIMVSDHEAFGLVYVEAMAKGLITIGTRGQGADGIIIDGVNGFLCPPKDLNALIVVLERIKYMNKQELEQISENAVKTAMELTDEKVSRQYLDAVSNQ